ncbi:hypothetical protein DM02DRAFT_650549 [Periconia macrospinosa]|uniref:Uncharacterized protein n=1 Tax=Periconia macrospinosa TaxID=97972 RepID=A0A2V1E7A3_9PLEO|nr:hypothetical protein DM02DRAFT_650549 [Periconia macrospinosa]
MAFTFLRVLLEKIKGAVGSMDLLRTLLTGGSGFTGGVTQISKWPLVFAELQDPGQTSIFRPFRVTSFDVHLDQRWGRVGKAAKVGISTILSSDLLQDDIPRAFDTWHSHIKVRSYTLEHSSFPQFGKRGGNKDDPYFTNHEVQPTSEDLAKVVSDKIFGAFAHYPSPFERFVCDRHMNERAAATVFLFHPVHLATYPNPDGLSRRSPPQPPAAPAALPVPPAAPAALPIPPAAPPASSSLTMEPPDVHKAPTPPTSTRHQSYRLSNQVYGASASRMTLYSSSFIVSVPRTSEGSYLTLKVALIADCATLATTFAAIGLRANANGTVQSMMGLSEDSRS